MDLKEIEICGVIEEEHWYYKSKALMLLQLIRPYNIHCISDIGAGSAFFAKYLLHNSSIQEAICIDINYSHEYCESINGKKIQFIRELNICNSDAAILIDVLEHIDDDRNFLENVACQFKKNSLFFITVPAFNFLWSDHDIFLEYKRRYTLSSLEVLAKNCGLTVLQKMYFFGLVFPLAASIRLIQKFYRNCSPKSQMRPVSPIINKMLYKVCEFETNFCQRNKYAALTAVCVAKKE